MIDKEGPGRKQLKVDLNELASEMDQNDQFELTAYLDLP